MSFQLCTRDNKIFQAEIKSLIPICSLCQTTLIFPLDSSIQLSLDLTVGQQVTHHRKGGSIVN